MQIDLELNIILLIRKVCHTSTIHVVGEYTGNGLLYYQEYTYDHRKMINFVKYRQVKKYAVR